MKIILVIDDDRAIREHLLSTLKCQEFYVLAAENGEEMFTNGPIVVYD